MSSSNRPNPTTQSQSNLEKTKEQETSATRTRGDQISPSKGKAGKEKKEDPAKDLDINKRGDFHRKRLEYLTLKKSGDRARAAQAKKDWKEFAEENGITPDEEDEKEEETNPELPFGWNEGEIDILQKQQAQKQGLKEEEVEEKAKELDEMNQIPNLEEGQEISKRRESSLKDNSPNK